MKNRRPLGAPGELSVAVVVCFGDLAAVGNIGRQPPSSLALGFAAVWALPAAGRHDPLTGTAPLRISHVVGHGNLRFRTICPRLFNRGIMI